MRCDTSKPPYTLPSSYKLLCRCGLQARCAKEHNMRFSTLCSLSSSQEHPADHDVSFEEEKGSVMSPYRSFFKQTRARHWLQHDQCRADRLNIRPSAPPTSPCYHEATLQPPDTHTSYAGVWGSVTMNSRAEHSKGECTMQKGKKESH